MNCLEAFDVPHLDSITTVSQCIVIDLKQIPMKLPASLAIMVSGFQSLSKFRDLILNMQQQMKIPAFKRKQIYKIVFKGFPLEKYNHKNCNYFACKVCEVC